MGTLVCEFRRLLGCEATFDNNDVEAWIRYIEVDYLQGQCPEALDCWFCSMSFRLGESHHESKWADKEGLFRFRMEHIYTQHLEAPTISLYRDMKMDYLMISHLYLCGIIDEKIWDAATRALDEDVSDFQTAPEDRPKVIYQQDILDEQHRYIYNQEKEDRMRRRARTSKSPFGYRTTRNDSPSMWMYTQLSTEEMRYRLQTIERWARARGYEIIDDSHSRPRAEERREEADVKGKGKEL